MRDLLTKAVISQAGDLWRRLPLAKTILEDEPLASLVEPLPPQLLHKENTLGDAIRALNEGPTSDLIIVDHNQRLWGTLDRDDLYRIIARIVVTSTAKSGLPIQHKLAEFLIHEPFVRDARRFDPGGHRYHDGPRDLLVHRQTSSKDG